MDPSINQQFLTLSMRHGFDAIRWCLLEFIALFQNQLPNPLFRVKILQVFGRIQSSDSLIVISFASLIFKRTYTSSAKITSTYRIISPHLSWSLKQPHNHQICFLSTVNKPSPYERVIYLREPMSLPTHTRKTHNLFFIVLDFFIYRYLIFKKYKLLSKKRKKKSRKIGDIKNPFVTSFNFFIISYIFVKLKLTIILRKIQINN